MRQSYSLYELNEYVRRVISLNFPEPIWVNCEISQIKEVRGNVYLDLIYHDENSGDITAQISANIWYKSHLFLKNKLGELLPSILKEGIHVLIKVQVDFNERYGLKLVIEDIDPAYTIGQVELNRQKLIQKLTNEGWINKNKLIDLPKVIQRIAVISAANAAGYIDFIKHLENNSYGFKFHVELFNAAMQGPNTERDVCNALKEIEQSETSFDVKIIIRGGGSKLDLSWFDNYNIGVEIAKSSIPVITGIGHDIDNSVSDIVANTSLKTPTAVADFIIQHNVQFESNINWTLQSIQQISQKIVRQQETLLNQSIQYLVLLPREIVRAHELNITQILNQCLSLASFNLQKHRAYLVSTEKQIHLMNPTNILRKGYTIVRQNNKVVSLSTFFNRNIDTQIEFYDGEITVPKRD